MYRLIPVIKKISPDQSGSVSFFFFKVFQIQQNDCLGVLINTWYLFYCLGLGSPGLWFSREPQVQFTSFLFIFIGLTVFTCPPTMVRDQYHWSNGQKLYQWLRDWGILHECSLTIMGNFISTNPTQSGLP